MRRIFILTIIALSLLITSEGFAASSQVYDKRSIGFGTLTDGKYCVWDSATKKVICNTSAVFTGTESTTGSAGSLKSPATTGVTTITGPGAGTTRNITIPDADVTIPATPIGLSGTMTDEQLLCGENTDGTTKAKSCGAKITYTEPSGSETLCRTGAGTTGACTNPVKLATFAWDGGGSAITAGATSKRCTVIPEASVITGWKILIDQDGAISTHVYKDAWSTSALATTDITASEPPAISATGGTDIGATGACVGWTTAVTASDIICAEVHSVTAATWANLVIYGTR